jgi:hypothetical protein
MGGPGPRATWVGKGNRGTRLDDLFAENDRAGVCRKSKLPSRSPNQDAAGEGAPAAGYRVGYDVAEFTLPAIPDSSADG